MRKSFIIIASMFVILINIGCDQGTKDYARKNFKGRGEIEVVDSFFVIRYAENSGGFLSMGSGIPQPYKTVVLLIFPCVALAATLIFLFLSKKFSLPEILILSCIIGGGISNMFDRIFFNGRVTDFMNFGVGGVRTGILNFADLSITFGVLILIILQYVKSKKEKSGLAAR